MNNIIIIGNLTKDPENSVTVNGVAVTTMTVAVNRLYKNSNGESITDYFRVTAYRALAERCIKYLYKGSKIAVEGEMQSRKFTDRQGVERIAWELCADHVEFLTPRASGDTAPVAPARTSAAPSDNELEPVENPDDLPF